MFILRTTTPHTLHLRLNHPLALSNRMETASLDTAKSGRCWREEKLKCQVKIKKNLSIFRIHFQNEILMYSKKNGDCGCCSWLSLALVLRWYWLWCWWGWRFCAKYTWYTYIDVCTFYTAVYMKKNKGKCRRTWYIVEYTNVRYIYKGFSVIIITHPRNSPPALRLFSSPDNSCLYIRRAFVYTLMWNKKNK